jgi:radical SAM superfamily enzyme
MNNEFAYPKYKPCGTRKVKVDGMGVVFHVYENLTEDDSDDSGASVFFMITMIVLCLKILRLHLARTCMDTILEYGMNP